MSELRKYGVLLTTAKAIQFTLYQVDGIDIEPAATFATGDVKISKDGGAEANTTNLPVDNGQGYSLILTATELTASRIRLFIVDQTGTKVWLDIEINIETHGNASAMFATDFDEVMRGTNNALLAANINLTGGAVDTVTTLTNKTGFSLAATGLDLIVSTATGMVAIAKAIWDRVLTGATHNLATSAGRRLRGLGDVVGGSVDDASSTASSFITDLVGAHDDHFGDQTLYFTTGALAGMSRIISTYNSSTKEVTFDEPFPAAPGNGDDFDVNPVHVHTKDQISQAVWEDTLVTYTDGMAGKRLKSITAVPVDEGTVNDASATTTTFISTLTGYEDGHFDDALCIVEIAPDQWQGRPILSYNGTTGEFVLDEPLTSAPANGINIAVQVHHIHPVSQIQNGLATEAKQDAQDLIITESRLSELDAGNLPSDNTAILTAIGDLNDPTAAAVAAAVAAYDMGNGRTIEEALAFLRNKWTIIGGTLTVYDTDDTTVLWTSVMTQTAGDPVSASDPA